MTSRHKDDRLGPSPRRVGQSATWGAGHPAGVLRGHNPAARLIAPERPSVRASRSPPRTRPLRPRTAGPSSTSRRASVRPSARPCRGPPGRCSNRSSSLYAASFARWIASCCSASRSLASAEARSAKKSCRSPGSRSSVGAPDGWSSHASRAATPALVIVKTRRRRPSVSRVSVSRPMAARRGGSLYRRVCGKDQKFPSVARTWRSRS